jgi:hypothetical protein
MINIELGGAADGVPATLNPRSGRCGYCVGLRVSPYWVSPISQPLRNCGGLGSSPALPREFHHLGQSSPLRFQLPLPALPPLLSLSRISASEKFSSPASTLATDGVVAMASRIGSGGIVVSNCFSLKTRSDCRSNRTNAVFRGVAIEFGRCLQQSGRISVTDKTFGHELAKSPRSPIQGAMPPLAAR